MLVCSIGMYAQETGLSLYLVGDATVIGWEGDENMRQPCRMEETYEGSGNYQWMGLLKHGSEGFKICKSGSWDGYHPSSEGFAIGSDNTSDFYTTSGNDWKWNPTNTDWQWYMIYLDTQRGELSWACYGDNPQWLTLKPVDGVISINDANDLRFLALMLRNNVNGESYNVKLTANIDYTRFKDGGFYGLGVTEKMPFKGEFDGQGHTITVDFQSHSTRFGLFGTVQGKVHDLKVAGKITATNKNQIGGICGLLKGDGSKISNCISEARIVDIQSGDGTIAGICAVTYNASTIENCAFYGMIIAPNRNSNGGILGWANSGASTTIKNCLVVADINWAGGEDFGRNNPSVINTYKTTASDETLANGQMTYKLNNNVSGGTDWYQTLGTDTKPTPLYTSKKVYANGTFYCDGVTPKGNVVMGNTDTSVIDPHVFGEDGVCTGCHAVGQEAALVDGVYQIANKGNLLWWAAFVNAGNPESCAVVTADLDMSDAVYVPAGTEDNKYVGTFDGQGHAITLKLERSDLNYQGLFGIATDGATIKNVIVKGSVKGNSYVAGIVGGSNGGTDGKTLNIFNCGNEAVVNAVNANGAGIIGVNMGGSAHFLIKDCYNVGNVTSGRESGAITGWTGGDKTTIKNTYNIGTVTNGEGDGFIRGGGNLVNTYNLSASDEMVTGGELCAKLGYAFRQNVGKDAYPIFDRRHNVVKEITEAGYATMYVPDPVQIPEGMSVYSGEYEESWLKLNRIADVVPANEPVVLKAGAGLYSFKPGGPEKEEYASFLNCDLECGLVNDQSLDGVNFTLRCFYFEIKGRSSYKNNHIRLYKNAAMDISCYQGGTITKIKFGFEGAYEFRDVLFSEGEYDKQTETWTGNARTLRITNKSDYDVRIIHLDVTYQEDVQYDNIPGNVLKGTAEDIDAAGKYILTKPDGEQIGFYQAETGTIEAGKAYLESSAGVKAIYFEGDDATGIKTIDNGQQTTDNGQQTTDNAIYNLSGQRLSKMQKGINIVNGKKILK